MTYDQIQEKLTTALAEEFEVDTEKLQPDAYLMEALDLDSLDLVDVVVLIEQHFGITIKQEDFIGIKTYKSFCDMIASKLEKNGVR